MDPDSEDDYDDDYYKQQIAFFKSNAFNNQVSFLTTRFETLFSQPPADLSSILRESPQAPCSEALGPSLLHAAEANPLYIDASVKSLIAGLSTTQDIMIHTDVVHNGPDKCLDPYIDTPFNGFVIFHVYDCLRHVLPGPHQTVISRKNTMFSYALLAGSAVRNELLDSNLINAFVDRSLQLPGADTSLCETNRREVVAIGGCLVLLVAGGLLVSEWRQYDVKKLEKVVKALQLLKEKKEIKYPTGVDLLERTIAVAEGEFAADTSPTEAWRLFFPDDAEDEEDDLQTNNQGMSMSMYHKLTFLPRRILFGR